jgi:hypothetical protein
VRHYGEWVDVEEFTGSKLDKEKTTDAYVSKFFHDDGSGVEVGQWVRADGAEIGALSRIGNRAVKRLVHVINGLNGLGTRLMHTVSKIYYTKDADSEAYTDADEVATIGAVDDRLIRSMVVPDYANIESTNLITTNGGTWTADRSGFVQCIFASNNAGQGVRIDGKYVFWEASADNQYDGVYVTLPVAKGQVIALSTSNTAFLSCYFIPPLLVKKELPVVVETNGSYSLEEVQTADTWIDGKPVYKRTFNVTSPSNNSAGYTTLISSNVDTPINHTFTMMRNDNTKSEGQNYYGVETNLWQFTTSINVTSTGGMSLIINVPQGSALYLSRPCVVTVWYTKTTD